MAGQSAECFFPVDGPVSTMAEEPQPEATIHLPLTPNLPTLHALLAESPRQLPIITPEAPPVEPEVPPILTLKTLFIAQHRKHWYADFKMPPVGPQVIASWETYLADNMPTHQNQPSIQHLAEDISTVFSQGQLQTPMILQTMTKSWQLTENSTPANEHFLIHFTAIRTII